MPDTSQSEPLNIFEKILKIAADQRQAPCQWRQLRDRQREELQASIAAISGRGRARIVDDYSDLEAYG